jgi:hypothetical protein
LVALKVPKCLKNSVFDITEYELARGSNPRCLVTKMDIVICVKYNIENFLSIHGLILLTYTPFIPQHLRSLAKNFFNIIDISVNKNCFVRNVFGIKCLCRIAEKIDFFSWA